MANYQGRVPVSHQLLWQSDTAPQNAPLPRRCGLGVTAPPVAWWRGRPVLAKAGGFRFRFAACSPAWQRPGLNAIICFVMWLDWNFTAGCGETERLFPCVGSLRREETLIQGGVLWMKEMEDWLISERLHWPWLGAVHQNRMGWIITAYWHHWSVESQEQLCYCSCILNKFREWLLSVISLQGKLSKSQCPNSGPVSVRTSAGFRSTERK